MYSREKQTELQIELAELQADLQVYLTICFGLLAVLAALTIGFFQVLVNLSSDYIFIKWLLKGLIPLTVISSIVIVAYFANLALAIRRKIERLRKRYLWKSMA